MKQISVFIENKKGKLADVLNLLAMGDIDLKALSIADTAEYGILRIVTDQIDKALSILGDNAYLAKVNNVLAVKAEDKQGSLAKVITALSEADISVEYTYAFSSAEQGVAVFVFRVDDNQKAVAALEKAGISATL